MILLMKGQGIQQKTWQVNETVAAGYSRIYFIESGNLFYEEGGCIRSLSPQTLYIFPAVVPYRMWCDHPFSCLWFHIDLFPIRLSSLIQLQIDSDSVLKLYLQLLEQLFRENLQEEIFCNNTITAFIQYLQKTYLPRQQIPMIQAVNYIRKHFREQNLTINELSSHLGYTPEHFIRTFTKALGITPYQYLLNMRMYEARRMLLENNPVGKTARAVGYEDVRSFSHAFQKKYEISPSQFKKEMTIYL